MILEFSKQQKEEDTILVFNVTQLGTEATVRTFDLTAVSYLKKISLDYHEIQGSRHKNGTDNNNKYKTTFVNLKTFIYIIMFIINNR